MNETLYLLCGRSASGKTTIAEILEEKLGMSQLQSYTTRPRRYEGERGHVFISEDDFSKLRDIIAYTEYDNHKYCCTKAQIDCANIYLIDVPGIETLLEKYQSDRPIVVIYFDADVRTRIDRMVKRNDSDTAIVSRLYTDEQLDWERELNKLVWHYKNNEGKDVDMFVVDANQDTDGVIAQIMKFIGG